jgi:TPR repeat protein
MELLRKYFSNIISREHALKLFKRASINGEFEVDWRLAACYQKGISVEKDIKKSQEYAQISMESGSIDGMFWLGRSFFGTNENKLGHQYIQ